MTHKPFKDLTDAEKGALLLAHHEGKRIEVGTYDYPCSMIWDTRLDPLWLPSAIYRIAPEPKTPDSIDWSHVADDVVAMARFPGADCAAGFISVPRVSDVEATWDRSGVYSLRVFASYRRGTVDWRDSLVIRPGYEGK